METLFRCPLCAAEGHDKKGRMLRIARRLDGGDLPYVGCRTHDSREGWRRIVRALRDAGVPERLLKPASGQTGHAEGASSAAGAVSPDGRGGFPEREGGLGEDDPIPDDDIQAWEDRLWSADGRKYLRYLRSRGLTDDTIRHARLGLGAFRWTPGKRPQPRIVIPIFDADGIAVSARLVGIRKGVKRLPLPHPELRNEDGTKYATYGPPVRLYGVDELATNTELGGEKASASVYIFAGEFDRLLAVQAGLLALTATSGEKALPRRADAAYLEGRDVVVCYDCDDAGRAGARKFARAAQKIGAKSVRIVDLDPDRDDGYDFADFAVESDGDVAEFLNLADIAPEYADDGSAGDGDGEAPPWEFSDRGIAEQVTFEYGHEVKYVPESDSWMGWDAQYGAWTKYPKHDAIAPVEAIARYVRSTRTALKDAEPDSAEDKYRAFLAQYLNQGKMSSVTRQMSTLWGSRVRLLDVDARPELLNTANGTLNLETMEIQDFAPEDMITKRTRGAVLEEGSDTAGERKWNEILERSVPDPGTRDALQQMCGVSLLDGNPLQIMVFLLGGTGTGKSVFSELFMYALGDYASSFNLSMFRDNQDEKPRADLVRALTQRVIFASEASEQWRLHVDQIKRLTGGDTITARLPHSGEYVERLPAFTPWFRTNQAPHIETPDLALYRRLLVFPFEQPYTGKRESGDFVLKYREAVADAALTWAIEGLIVWREEGRGEIERSGEMVRAEMAFREALNETQMFLAERTEPDGAAKVEFKDLYQAYEVWCEESGIPDRDRLSKKALGDRLSALGYRKSEGNSKRWRHGIALRPLSPDRA